MKKLLSIAILLFAFIIANAQIPAGCCPKFSLATSPVNPCDTNACKSNGPVGIPGGAEMLVACKNQLQTYYVTPTIPGFTYAWTVTGGSIANPSANPGVITWGASSTGYIQVIVTNGSCRDTIRKQVCLLDAPTAIINFSPNPVCKGTPVNFTGINSIGAVSYYWNFGDGTSSTLPTPPPHIYNTAGTYTVILTVSNSTGGSSANGGEPRTCGCKDTAMVVLTVSNTQGIDIHTDNCKKMLCYGDTIKYCTSTTGCSPLQWVTRGGRIISGQGTTCITVVWDSASVYPTTVTLNTTCPGTCGNSATLNVPVLYPSLPIQGPLTVCPGSGTSYFLPALPGTFYKWTLSGGGTIAGYDSNHNVININWNNFPSPGGPYTLTCNYNNPYSGCSGSSTIQINVRPPFTLFGPSQACVGQTFSYCATGPVATWTYLPATGFTAVASGASCQNITWNVANNYTITATPVTPANFCSLPAILNVIVKDTPALNNIVGPLVVCPGQNTMYSISSNMNAGIFNWNITGGTIVQQYGAHNDSILVTFSGSGTLNVMQTVNGCSSSPKTINVTTVGVPAAPTGNNSVCIDAVETYTVAGPIPPGGFTFSLSNPSLGSIIGQTANTVQVQWNGGPVTAICNVCVSSCGGGPVCLLVTVKTPANGTITATGNLCTPGVTLTASISPAPASYDWYRNGVFVINTVAPTYVATLPGFYKVKSPTGCFGTATINVPNTFTSTVSISSGSVTTICAGDPINVVLTATVQSNNTCTYSYQWYLGATPVGSNSPTYTATALGSYTVVISCGNCTATSNVITVSQGICSGPCTFNYNPLKQVGNDIGGPSIKAEDEEGDNGSGYKNPFSYSININPPVASPCNVVTFSANYNFTAPNSPNSGAYWNFGDGFGATSSWSGMSGTTTATPHTYTTPGIYLVSVLMYSNCPSPPTPHICPVWDTIQYTVPVAANFGFNVICKQIILSNLSSTLPSLGCNILTYAWSYTGPAGATFSNASIANPVLNTLTAGTYNITLTITSNCGGCQATINYPVVITAPSASFTPPSPICAGTAVPFTTAGAATNTYNWNFGDGYQSNLQNTTHTFTTPPSSVVTLTVTDVMGCTAIASQTVTILPALTVAIPTDKFICPGSSYTLSTTPGGFTTYQWYFNGVPTVTTPTYTVSSIGEYYVQVSNGPGCVAKSNKMHIWHHPKPIADIQGQTIQCLFGGSGTLFVQNSVNDPNCTYSWTVSPAATFSPNNTVYNPTVSVTSPGTYQFILTVTNTITGCIAKDTFCVWAYNSPSVTIGPTGYLCEGIMHTYSVVSPNPSYVYQWSNGVTGTSMTTAQAGTYSASVLNPATGCTGSSNFVTIKKRPYVALFPLGCDTLCDTAKIIPPLPLGPGQTYGSLYNIQWFVDGVYNSTGPVLNINSLSLGNHTIEILVNFLTDSCAARSGKYDLFIKHCGDCDCKGSHWGEVNITEGQSPPAKNNAKANVVVIGNPIPVSCGKLLTLGCNKTYTINGSYICKDTACKGKVTYSLQPPTGPAIVGTNPFTFTTTQTGTYILTMYGWCGDKKCDSCDVDIIVKCDPIDCCKGSTWEEQPYYYFEQNGNPNPVKIDCNKETTVIISGDKCKLPLVIGAKIKCGSPDCISSDSVFVYDNANNIVQSGPAPLTIAPNALPNGNYTVVINGYCGGKLCLTCKFILKVDCKEIDCCKGSHWGEMGYTLTDVKNGDAKANTGFTKLECNKEYTLQCKKTYNFNATYICAQPDCKGTVQYQLNGPGGPIGSGPVPFSFTPTQSGNYILLLQGYCGGVLCNECKITFHVDCPPPPCCPYEIKADAGNIKYDYGQIPNATLGSQTFTINGLALATITEVRANVVSYDITDNFGKECMKCVNLPFTWASIASATNIGTASPKITMYGGATVPSFNGSGAGAYQNPREVIWNNGSQINIPANTSIGMNFILPPVPAIDCCELKGKICVNFTFRDNECKECEVIVCFEFVIKKK